MVAVARFVTFADVGGDVADVAQASVSTRHEAALTDSRRVVIFDDRGWSWSVHGGKGDIVQDPWTSTSPEDIEDTARVVVGPDEPFDGRSHDDMEADHWAYIAGLLQQHDVGVTAHKLKRLPHDVVLSERLLARVHPDWTTPASPQPG
jgi:hypothetical protein